MQAQYEVHGVAVTLRAGTGTATHLRTLRAVVARQTQIVPVHWAAWHGAPAVSCGAMVPLASAVQGLSVRVVQLPWLLIGCVNNSQQHPTQAKEVGWVARSGVRGQLHLCEDAWPDNAISF